MVRRDFDHNQLIKKLANNQRFKMNKIVIGILGAIGLVMIVAGSVFLGVFPGILRKKVREVCNLLFYVMQKLNLTIVSIE